MKLEMKKLDTEKYAVIDKETKNIVLVCNRAFNAHLIATILQDDELGDVTKKVILKE